MSEIGRRPSPSAALAQHRRKAEAYPPPESRPLHEVPVPPATREMLRGAELVRAYRFGPCSVLVSREGRWHLSIAHPTRYPTWDEIREVRYRIVPDSACMAMILPPSSRYVNVHPNCFQLVEIDDPGT